eukprot:Plantae.Rhodophyta-Purpureofilum_apyrenoidigerum.ctg12373.p1 GENE.Plantae.Rhodophyta-Purpureofilum_apyrenoidigerum.ctg12373~~Plantae.Rhodophyta-Purpureofilum_apyrenoidigerum.ctg12373.p1  ORF type:complete len:168 (+),score=20.40 Plantae.Rhodophyta-Purpureofilum_apyrenoidigerum.ctg12373:65-568(+)
MSGILLRRLAVARRGLGLALTQRGGGVRFASGDGSATDMDSDDDFKPQVKKVATDKSSIQQEISEIVSQNPIVLFMKGLPSAPQCGFSFRTVQILNAHGSEYRAFNVLSSVELRDGIKQFSHWPTIPQLFVKGEFVGGCDIVESLHRSGELKSMLQDAKATKSGKEV